MKLSVAGLALWLAAGWAAAPLVVADVPAAAQQPLPVALVDALTKLSGGLSTANILDGNSALGGQVSRWFDGDPHQGS